MQRDSFSSLKLNFNRFCREEPRYNEQRHEGADGEVNKPFAAADGGGGYQNRAEQQ